MRTRVQNTLQSMALGNGLRRGASLWSQAGLHALEALPLAPYASQRRAALLTLYPQLQERIDDLNQQVSDQAWHRPQARLLMTHPGVGPVTALATEVFLGDPTRFADGKAVASYIGMIPSEHSSGGRQRLGALSKQGNTLLRYLWVEAAMHAVRGDPELKRFYRRKLVQKGVGKARVAAARKLGIRLWIMLCDEIDYKEFCRRGEPPEPACPPPFYTLLRAFDSKLWNMPKLGRSATIFTRPSAPNLMVWHALVGALTVSVFLSLARGQRLDSAVRRGRFNQRDLWQGP
jgi:hypothetical protein